MKNVASVWENAKKVHFRRIIHCCPSCRRTCNRSPVYRWSKNKKDKQPFVLWKELNDRNFESKWRQSLQAVQQRKVAHRGGDAPSLKINFVIHLYIYFKCTQQQVRKKLADGSEAPQKKKSAFGWKAISRRFQLEIMRINNAGLDYCLVTQLP